MVCTPFWADAVAETVITTKVATHARGRFITRNPIAFALKKKQPGVSARL
jgi:hypothetical protein